MDFNNKKVAVIGLGKSGLEAALLLFNLGAQVKISDCQDNESLRNNAKISQDKNIKIELGRNSFNFIEGSELIVVSPGVKKDSPIMIFARQSGIPVIGEIELGFLLCPAQIIAITGTNGKTTVTTLVGEILKSTGRKVFVCGNIGNPFCKDILNMTKDDLVSLEVSSFQLENIVDFKPKVAALLNFSRNHLDRHKDMQTYLDVKKRIFMNQDSNDWAILNYHSSEIRTIASEIKSKILYFNSEDKDNSEFGSNPNYLAAIAIGSIFGISEDTYIEVFRQFRGLEHRLEYVRTINGIDFINDSKATTVDAAIWALNNLNKPVIMIAGGRDKGADFSAVKDLLRDKVKKLILIGEAKEKIRNAIDNALPTKDLDTLEEAVCFAYKTARNGDCVLLSPMCASFDMFSDFEERGEVFKDIINKL